MEDFTLDGHTLTIFEQLNNSIIDKSKKSNIIDHSLEKGLGNEEVVREVLRDFFPAKYGIAKGKIMNFEGKMSKQCDIIIYDALNCPKLFIDENNNQIIPIEGAFSVFQVKTTLNKTKIKESFDNLFSVYKLKDNINSSINNYIEHYPPHLGIIAFTDNRKLTIIKDNYVFFNKKYKVKKNSSSYSKKSPGYKDIIGEKYLIDQILVLNKGMVHHMYNGRVSIGKWGKYSLGIFLTHLLSTYNEIRLPDKYILNYFNFHFFDPERKLIRTY